MFGSGISKSEARRHFGVSSGNSFSLKNRLWARLMEQLALMRVVKDPDHENVYGFSDNRRTILVRVSTEVFENYYLRIIELLDSSYRPFLREEIFPDSCGNFTSHPASEVFELVKGIKDKELEQIQTLNFVLAQI